MAEIKTISAVEMVRRIRDEQATALAGKSEEEILAFFRQAAETARQDTRRGRSRPGHDQGVKSRLATAGADSGRDALRGGRRLR